MPCLVMFVAAVCFSFLPKLKWPKTKSVYESVDLVLVHIITFLYFYFFFLIALLGNITIRNVTLRNIYNVKVIKRQKQLPKGRTRTGRKCPGEARSNNHSRA